MTGSGFLSSPRRRRRLAWAGALLAVAAAVALVVVLVPSRGGRNSTGQGPPPAPNPGQVTNPARPGFAVPLDPAAERARGRAEAAVRPLAAAFLAAVQREDRAAARKLLDPPLAAKGGLPVSVDAGSAWAGTAVAFSDASLVGVVVTYEPARSQPESPLYALRFRKRSAGWRIEYAKQGHTSQYVDAGNFSPSGFLPGTASRTTWSWLPLVLGLVGVIALVVLAERLLSRKPRRAEA